MRYRPGLCRTARTEDTVTGIDHSRRIPLHYVGQEKRCFTAKKSCFYIYLPFITHGPLYQSRRRNCLYTRLSGWRQLRAYEYGSQIFYAGLAVLCSRWRAGSTEVMERLERHCEANLAGAFHPVSFG